MKMTLFQWMEVQEIYMEYIKTVEPEITGYFEKFMGWADEIRKLKS